MDQSAKILPKDSITSLPSSHASNPPSPWIVGIVAAIFATGAVIGGYYLGEYIAEHGLGSGSEGITNGRIIGAVSGGLVSIIITALICRCIYKAKEDEQPEGLGEAVIVVCSEKVTTDQFFGPASEELPRGEDVHHQHFAPEVASSAPPAAQPQAKSEPAAVAEPTHPLAHHVSHLDLAKDQALIEESEPSYPFGNYPYPELPFTYEDEIATHHVLDFHGPWPQIGIPYKHHEDELRPNKGNFKKVEYSDGKECISSGNLGWVNLDKYFRHINNNLWHNYLLLYENKEVNVTKKFLIFIRESNADIMVTPWLNHKQAIQLIIDLTITEFEIKRLNAAIQESKMDAHIDAHNVIFKETNYYCSKPICELYKRDLQSGHIALCPMTEGDGNGHLVRSPPKRGFLVKKAVDGTLTVTEPMDIEAATQLMEQLTQPNQS